MKLSVIVPCKNEEGNIKKLYEKINGVLDKILYEIIFIDDGSSDDTLKKMKEVYQKDKKHVRVISFSRNYKKEAAMYAGLKASTGEYTCIIDGDLQQNPELLLEMMNILDNEKEYDEVSTIMSGRTDNKLMKIFKHWFYKLIDKISDVRFKESASDFRMFRSNVRDALVDLKERGRFTKGLFPYVGFNVKYIPFSMEKRNSGKTKFGFIPSMKYAFEGIINFSTFPLKLGLIFGAITNIISIIYLITGLIINKFNILVFLLLFMFSILFILVGILGLYIANIQLETKKRPLYIVRETLGIDE